jgi:hypothetical protein
VKQAGGLQVRPKLPLSPESRRSSVSAQTLTEAPSFRGCPAAQNPESREFSRSILDSGFRYAASQ